MISFHFWKKGWNIVEYGRINACLGKTPYIIFKDGWIEHLTSLNLQKNRWQWKTIIFTFWLLQPWTSNQSEWTNISYSRVQFLAERNLRLTVLYLYGDLQTVLRFHRNKYTVNSQLQSHVEEHSNLRTLKKLELSNILKKCGRED